MKRLLAVALPLLALTLARPQRGEARYEYARQVGKRCSACHVGGHPDVTNLNPAGLHFMARGTLEGLAKTRTTSAGGAALTPPSPPSAAAASGGSPAPANAAHAQPPPGDAAGQELFARNCAPCHGPRGGGTDKAKSLLEPARARGAAEVERVIREGITGTTMFAFGEALSAREIETLARYVQELRRP